MIGGQQRFQIHRHQPHLRPIHFHHSCWRPLLLAHAPMVRATSLFHSTRDFFTASQDDNSSIAPPRHCASAPLRLSPYAKKSFTLSSTPRSGTVSPSMVASCSYSFRCSSFIV